jgi:penicillin-binding protein 1C
MRLRSVAASLLALLCAGALLDHLFPPPLQNLRREAAGVIEARDGRPLRFFLPPDQIWRLPVAYDDLPRDLVRAVILAEDRRFYHHPGVDPIAVLRAAVANLRAGRVVSGASTLPMQIARLLQPRPRTFAAKIGQALRALQITHRLTHRQVLQAYLNLAPYGGNLEGVGAASWFYFGKQPKQLSLGEIALLVALPRSPNRFDPTRDAAAARVARDGVLRLLRRRGMIDAAAMQEAMRQPLPSARRPPPFEAPHLAQYVTDRFGAGRRLRTTIDSRLQRIAEEIVTRRITGLRADGIGNAAVVVIDNRDRAVRALVGSAAFFDTARSGQVNGAVAPRSPGSTLKPFLYALAFDEGLLVPDSYVLDIPTDFSGYVAEDYDGRYRGRVTVREALTQSLNAPPVRLLSQIGVERFLRLLRRGGLDTLDRPAAAYGLPLILGGGEVSLLDLTGLYSTLADGGLYRPVRLLETPPPNPTAGERLLSPAACGLIAEMLTGLERPDLPRAWDLTIAAPEVAWKTGTSYGHRDAWAVGLTLRYSVGVWVGNFDGAPAKGISGARHAAPLFFDVVRAVESGGHDRAPIPPEPAVIDRTEVCALSHQRPGPFCTHRVLIDTIPGRTRLPLCTYHRRVFVDAANGTLLSGRCLDRRPHRTRVLELFPSELVAWWRGQGRPAPLLPLSNALCGASIPGAVPAVVSPDPGTPYRLRRDAPAAWQRIPLIARAGATLAPQSGRLYWYQDGRLVASGPPEAQLFVSMSPGEHRLVVVDEMGRSDSLHYRVEE